MPRVKPFLLVPGLALLVAFFSGCFGNGSGPSSGTETGVPSPTNDANTASIDGRVFDDEEVPLGDVYVGLRRAGTSDGWQESRSDEGGRFSYSYLAPGTYEISAAKLGFRDRRTELALQANQPPYPVTLNLAKVPPKEPFHEDRIERGVVGCGVMVAGSFGQYGQSLCTNPVTTAVIEDKYELEFVFDGYPWGNVSASVFEMAWDSTQALGNGLLVLVERNGCDNFPEATFADLRGSTPLRERVSADQMYDVVNTTACPAAFCVSTNCTLQARVSPWPDTLGPYGAPVDVGVTLQQDFEVFVSVWFFEPAPADWSLLPPS